jgi:hypothetical protein
MNKRSDANAEGKPKKPESSSALAAQTISVLDGDKTSREELMKIPKAYVVEKMAIPENKVRFWLDVDDRTKQGKQIIALMACLRDGNAIAIKAVAEILAALANIVAEKPASRK